MQKKAAQGRRMVRYSISMSAKDHDDLESLATASMRSKSALIRLMIARALKHPETVGADLETA